jgi:kumamolisin
MPGRKVERIGSRRDEPERAAAAGDVDPGERIAITVHLKRRSPDRFAPGSAGDLMRLRAPITREALAAQRGRTHGRAAARVIRFAEANRLDLRETDITGRRVMLEGTARQMRELFGVSLAMYDDGQWRFRARTGPLFVPAEIAPWTRAILGFDQRPLVRKLRGLAGAGQGDGLLPTEIAALYGLRLAGDVSSQCVGVIALGGGYLQTDLAAASATMGRPAANVVDKSVAGATNAFGGGTLADQEIALDLQVLAGLLPAARIVVYFAPNQIQSLADALHQAVWDDDNRPQVLSVSWGSAEKFWTPDARDAVQAVLADAVRLQVSVAFAAGDELATAGLTDGRAHVSFPASSPYVLSCGGTMPTLDSGGAIATESVWNEGFQGTGGGISDVFPVPDYQSGLALPPSVNDEAVRRGVPDVACAAAATPGYRILINGQPTVKDGTSAATPLWAALVAHASAQRGAPIGLVNPALYANAGLLRQITRGNNRVDGTGTGYDAGTPWNACTGLGVPNSDDIVAALAEAAIA